MSINSINYGASLLGLSVQNISNQLSNLSVQLSSQTKSTNYAGMGVNEGFAIAARSQLSNIAAFGTTITNVNTVISAANTGLQSISKIASQIQSNASSSPQNLTSTGQTIGQQNALSELSAAVGILNTQVGNRYIFSGTAINSPALASADDILNGTPTLAGLKQLISERQQADLGTGTGRLTITAPALGTTVNVAEDSATSPFGLKLNAVQSSLTNAVVTGPSGSPANVNVDFTAGNPNPGDSISFTFNLPDGTTEAFKLTASNTTPLPTGSFAIGATPAATTANFNAALTQQITTLANTSLVAASAVEAGDNFFNTDGTATANNAINNQVTPLAAPITGATALSGTSGTDSIASGFQPGDTITVNGTTITFVASGATGSQLNVTDNVQALLTKIDQITGTTKPSTVHGGVISINTGNASALSITTTPAGRLASLGFTGASITAAQPPLRVSGSPLSTATSLVNGSATTVKWYTGNSGPGSPRSTASVRVDTSQSVDFGAQANEDAIRRTIQAVATYAAVTVSPSGVNSPAATNALSQRIASALTPGVGQQTIQDIQTDFATAQTTMQDATARQTQTKAALQNLVDQTEGIDQNQVASQLLALQNSLQASYQATSMLAQLSLTKFL